MTNKPDYLRNDSNKEHSIEDLKQKEFKSIDELTEEDVYIASSGLTHDGLYKALVEIFWDIKDEKDDYTDYISAEAKECMVKLNKKNGMVNLDLVFEQDTLELFEFTKITNDYLLPENSDFHEQKSSQLEIRISPLSLEGEVVVSLKDPLLSALTSDNYEDFNVLRFAYLEDDVTIGRIGEKDIKWKVQTFPLNYNKSDLIDKGEHDE